MMFVKGMVLNMKNSLLIVVAVIFSLMFLLYFNAMSKKNASDKVLLTIYDDDFESLKNYIETQYLGNDNNTLKTDTFLYRINFIGGDLEYKVIAHEKSLKIVFQNGYDNLEGCSIIFQAIVDKEKVLWNCTGGDLPKKYRPYNCR